MKHSLAKSLTAILALLSLMFSSIVVPRAHAGGVVGNGTPGSCTEVALNIALVGGGGITFNCGANPKTIGLTSEKLIEFPTTIDGGGKITLDGNWATRLFNVNTLDPVWPVGFKNITLSNGSADNGGAVYFGADTVWMENVAIVSSYARMDGGAIYVGGGSLTLTNVALYANLSSQEGGAVYNNGGTLNFTNVLFQGNTALGWGGGLNNNNQGTATITGSTFRQNRAGVRSGSYSNGPGGGGIDNYNSVLTVSNSLFDRNISYQNGGGLRTEGGGNVTLTSVTFSGNETDYAGGGISNQNATTLLINATLYGNKAAPTLGDALASWSSLSLKNTIITGNGKYSLCLSPSNTNIISLGHNLSNNTSCATYLNKAGDRNNTNPLLGVLQNNGGSTWTHFPQAGSPTINGGTNSGCPATDQRGVRRPQGAACDIGAVEVGLTATFKSVGIGDGWVLESGENSNAGGTKSVATDNILVVGDNTARKQYRSILHFNTVGLPDNAVIIKATLRIMKAGVSWNPSTLGALLVDMTKPSFGAAALALNDFQAVAGKPNIFNPFTIVGSWYSATLKSEGLAYVNRLGTTQFRLRFTKDDDNDILADYLMFYNGNAPVVNRPQLLIEYYLP